MLYKMQNYLCATINLLTAAHNLMKLLTLLQKKSNFFTSFINKIILLLLIAIITPNGLLR